MMHTTTSEGACTDGTSEGKPPDPLYERPRCTCIQAGALVWMGDEQYETKTRIRAASCPIHTTLVYRDVSPLVDEAHREVERRKQEK
jgi:hypothetical protein